MKDPKVLDIEDTDKDTILDIFNKSTDDEGYIVHKESGDRYEDPYQKKPVHVDNFTVMPGSAIFVRSEPASIIAHRATHWDGE